MNKYRYTECGIDYVFIEGMNICVDDAGDETVTIPHVAALHKAIATAIVTKPYSMTGKELRFLRTEMGITQAELALAVNREPLAISRWERGEVAQIDQNAEAIIRLMVVDELQLEIKPSVRELVRWSIPSAKMPELRIDGSKPGIYTPIPTAA